MARRTLGQAQWNATARVMLWPERTLTAGPLAIRPRRAVQGAASEVFLSIGRVVGSADRATLVVLDEGPAVEFEGVVLAGGGERRWRIEAEKWRQPIPRPVSRRVVMQERSNAEVADAARRTEHEERKDPSYEWCLLYKRWLHPVAAFVFPLALLPLGAGRRRGLAAGAVGIGYLVAVRGGDNLAEVIGPWAGASAGPVFMLLVLAVAWWRWRDA